MWNIISKKKDLLHDKPNEKVRKKSVFFVKKGGSWKLEVVLSGWTNDLPWGKV